MFKNSSLIVVTIYHGFDGKLLSCMKFSNEILFFLMRKRYFINWDESPSDRTQVWIYEHLRTGGDSPVALVFGESPVETIMRARFIEAALNICDGIDLEELETLSPRFISMVLQHNKPKDEPVR